MELALFCPKCNAVRTPDEVDYDEGKARCTTCGSRIEVHDSQQEMHDQPATRKIVTPRELQVEKDGSQLRITRTYSKLAYIIIMVWACFLLILVTFPLLNVIYTDELKSNLWMIIPFGAGLLVLYGSLAGIVNRTEITARSERLTIRYGPLPWFGNTSVKANKVNQFYITSRWRRTRRGRYRVYQLRALLKNGMKKILLRDIGSLQEALYLEQEIEEHFVIMDQPVAGSISRSE